MMPFAFPPIVAMAALVAGVTVARVIRREWQRINDELESMARFDAGRFGMAHADIVDRATLPKLRRDPATGVYRPE